jgi:plasmid stabilization system protein ParE
VSIEFTPLGAADVRIASHELARDLGVRVAVTFQRRLRDTLAGLETFPLSGSPVDPPYPNHPGLRFRPVRRFESRLVFYVPTPTGILLMRVVYSGRDLDAVFGE